MAPLHIIPWNIKRFTHNAEAKILYADMSDFGDRGPMSMFEQLYDDAADVGIAVYNYKTDSVTHWEFVSEIRDADNDVTHWVLVPTGESCRKHPGVQDYSIHILND